MVAVAMVSMAARVDVGFRYAYVRSTRGNCTTRPLRQAVAAVIEAVSSWFRFVSVVWQSGVGAVHGTGFACLLHLPWSFAFVVIHLDANFGWCFLLHMSRLRTG